MAIASVLRQPIEFEQQVFLFAIQVDRCFYFDLAVKISLRFGPHIADAFTTQAKDPLRLALRRDLQVGPAFKGRYVDITAQGRSRQADRHFTVQVVAIAGEDRVFLEADLHIKVSRGGSRRARLPFPGEPDLIAIIHSRRDFDLQRLGFLYPASALALTAP